MNGEAKQLIPSINTIDFILKMKKLVTMLKDLLTLPLTKVWSRNLKENIMIKIKLADSIIKSHLVDSKGNSYCSIPISVDKKLNVEGLFDKLVAIDPKLKSYDQSTSPYYTIFVNVPIDMELEAKEANSQVGENTYEIMWGLPQDIILSKLPCFVPKHHWKKVEV